MHFGGQKAKFAGQFFFINYYTYYMIYIIGDIDEVICIYMRSYNNIIYISHMKSHMKSGPGYDQMISRVLTGITCLNTHSF